MYTSVNKYIIPYPNAFMSDDEMLRKSIEQTKKLMEMENEN